MIERSESENREVSLTRPSTDGRFPFVYLARQMRCLVLLHVLTRCSRYQHSRRRPQMETQWCLTAEQALCQLPLRKRLIPSCLISTLIIIASEASPRIKTKLQRQTPWSSRCAHVSLRDAPLPLASECSSMKATIKSECSIIRRTGRTMFSRWTNWRNAARPAGVMPWCVLDLV